jgi:uncharacterized damage-inducible protein DinB
MPPTAAPGARTHRLDVRKSLLEEFAINEKASQLLLDNVAAAVWRAQPPSGKGRSIGAIAVHAHHVRLMWLFAAEQTSKLSAKFDPDKATRSEVLGSLKGSADAIRALLRKALDNPGGKVRHFKPNVVAFVGYLIAHDSHHRGQITMLARLLSPPLPPQTNFGLWEWDSLWRACGFGK